MPRVVRRQLGSAARTYQKISHFKRAKAGTLPGPAEGNCAPQAHPGAGSCAGCLSLFACGCVTLIRKCGSGVLGVSSPRRGKARTLESPARQKTHRNCPSKVVPPPVIFVRLFLSNVTTQETQFRWPAHESGRPRRRSVPVGGLARPPGYPRRGGGHTQVGAGPARLCYILQNLGKSRFLHHSVHHSFLRMFYLSCTTLLTPQQSCEHHGSPPTTTKGHGDEGSDSMTWHNMQGESQGKGPAKCLLNLHAEGCHAREGVCGSTLGT